MDAEKNAAIDHQEVDDVRAAGRCEVGGVKNAPLAVAPGSSIGRISLKDMVRSDALGLDRGCRHAIEECSILP